MKKISLIIGSLLIAGSSYATPSGVDIAMTCGLSQECGASIASINVYLANATWLKARNAANSADINLLEADATDDTVLNADTGDVIKLAIAGTTEATLDNDQLSFSGAAAEIVPGATSIAFKNNADAVENLKITDAGQVTMAGASLGWSYVTGANTACTTTCNFAAVFGVDLAAGASAPVLVGPSAATADACVCAGAN